MPERVPPIPAPRRPGRLALVVLAAVALTVVVALLASGVRPWSGGSGRAATTGAAGANGASRVPAAAAAQADPAKAFLATYVRSDGRVSRIDQGGDTVSEGQAYGLLLAAASGDRARFGLIWQWTRAHLQRPDGLLSWTWSNGHVTDPTSASDADLDAAHALLAAGHRFARPDWTSAGLRLGQAILTGETVETKLGRILTAGSWADQQPWMVDPSYDSPLAVSYLAQVTKDPRWNQLADGNRAVLSALLRKSPLPPDWAQVRSDGQVFAMPAPANSEGAGTVRFGLDAARITIRLAASCSADDRALAARLNPVLARPADQVRGEYDLGGRPVVSWQQPVQLVAVAASSGAAGDPTEGAGFLTAARELSATDPTYYGAAWTALGTALLAQTSDLRPAGCPAAPVLG